MPTLSNRRLLIAPLVALVLVASALPAGAQRASRRILLPYIEQTRPCLATGSSYELIPVEATPEIRYTVETNPDFNLTVRGWVTNTDPSLRRLVDYNGGFDLNAPQLYGLFADGRTPVLTSTHRVYDWDWSNNRRGAPISAWPVTLLGMATAPGETLHLPGRGPDIYQGRFHAMVLYASEQRITWTYTRFGYISSPQGGYGVHVENGCVDPNLVALYNAAHAAGRGSLPGLRGGQPFGRARTSEILVAIRDTGSFMDPRSRKDWWRGRAAQEGDSAGGQPRPPAPTPLPTPSPTPEP
ncbi:MAG TPA: hypothetical protein VG370_25270 [Chloroflexota bacterium]|nr:hypothetical protein [Chloroflexota bacterium]